MAEKIEKSIPWITILAIFALVVFGVGIVLNEIIADAVIPSVTVGNVAPQVGTVILNSNNDITLIENTTVTVIGTTTLTDDNGYDDIISVTSTLYLNNTTCDSAAEDPNWCYYISSCATSNCSDLTCDATCTANVWFVAEATDASSTNYSANVWEMAITAVDSGNNATSATGGQDVNSSAYLNVDGAIAYGSVNPGATSSDNTINTNATNTGNSTIDTELSGEDMATGSWTIAVGQQKYSSSTIGDWDAEGTALTVSATVYDLDLPKPTATTSNSYDALYWVIRIPTTTNPGTYEGTNTVDAFWVSSP